MKRFTDACLRYLDEDLTPSESEDFDRLIAESPEAARELARCLIDEQYFTKAQASDADARIDASDASALNLAVRYLERHEDSDQVLRELLRMEREAQTLQISTAGEDGPKQANTLTWGEVSSATVYLLSQTAKSTTVRWLAAAAILLAATLAITFVAQNNNDVPNDPALTQGPTKAPGQATMQPVVASLTAVNNVQWQSESGVDSPVVGDDLTAGQSLTLLQGTAQITTLRGAIANLQAPCAVELLHGGNGLRLMHGRMVGICETESSKGFLVRTTHMDVTDLGTRFGVDATRSDATEVHVFEGEVSVALPLSEGIAASQVLSIGQAVVAETGRGELVIVEQDAPRFAAIQYADLLEQPHASGLAGVRTIAGDLKTASSTAFIGKEPEQWPFDGHAVVFHDFVGPIYRDVLVDLAEPGDTVAKDTGPQSQLPGGISVRSYIIYKSANADGSKTTVQGSVTFDNEIVGIITTEQGNNSFSASVRPTTPIFSPGPGTDRWLEPNSFQERVGLSEDRRTMSFACHVKQSTDTIRILVRAEETDDQP